MKHVLLPCMCACSSYYVSYAVYMTLPVCVHVYRYTLHAFQLLQEHSLDQLHSLWSEVTSQSVCRQQCIHALDHTLCSVEEQRQKMVL